MVTLQKWQRFNIVVREVKENRRRKEIEKNKFNREINFSRFLKTCWRMLVIQIVYNKNNLIGAR